MICKICGNKTKIKFSEKVLSKYNVDYTLCSYCGFLGADKPFWLDEAYESPITSADTGLMARNIDLSRKIAVLIYYLFGRDGCYLDYAGGYGVFTRLMRDAGFRFFHTDLYTKNLFAQEFEWDRSCRMDGITCFECFEHLPDPMVDIESMLSISQNLFFTTVLLPDEIPPIDWEYYGFDHGQHISFFAPKTLDYIASTFGVSVVSRGNLHVFTPAPLPQKRLDFLIRKANRLPHPFAQKTMFETVSRKMRRS